MALPNSRMFAKPKIYASRSSLPRRAKQIDIMDAAARELFFIEHPTVTKQDAGIEERIEKYIASKNIPSVWIHYPWRNIAIRIPSEDTYFRLRTARNRNLIRSEEQSRYRKAVIGVAGLSVGSAVVSGLVATGGPKRMKLADPDTIDITNLNRMRASLLDVGMNKTVVAARQVWELDPFADLHLHRDGLRIGDIRAFIGGKPRLDVFIDEMDDIRLKIECRKVCRFLRIPVVMATDNGDGVIIDVERFDLEPKRPLFHGRVRIPEHMPAVLTRRDFLALSSSIIDPAAFTPRQQESILAIGKTLSGVAQIGTAAAIAGATVAYAVREIVCEHHLPSGRYVLSGERAFDPRYDSVSRKKARAAQTRKFEQTIIAQMKKSG